MNLSLSNYEIENITNSFYKLSNGRDFIRPDDIISLVNNNEDNLKIVLSSVEKSPDNTISLDQLLRAMSRVSKSIISKQIYVNTDYHQVDMDVVDENEVEVVSLKRARRQPGGPRVFPGSPVESTVDSMHLAQHEWRHDEMAKELTVLERKLATAEKSCEQFKRKFLKCQAESAAYSDQVRLLTVDNQKAVSQLAQLKKSLLHAQNQLKQQQHVNKMTQQQLQQQQQRKELKTDVEQQSPQQQQQREQHFHEQEKALMIAEQKLAQLVAENGQLQEEVVALQQSLKESEDLRKQTPSSSPQQLIRSVIGQLPAAADEGPEDSSLFAELESIGESVPPPAPPPDHSENNDVCLANDSDNEDEQLPAPAAASSAGRLFKHTVVVALSVAFVWIAEALAQASSSAQSPVSQFNYQFPVPT